MRCKNCSDKFTPKRFLQKYCEKDECVGVMVKNTMDKLKKINAKDEKKATKLLKDSLLTRSDYLKMLQTVFNTYIRERDKDKNCISCDVPMKGRKGDASHFYATTYSGLRFEEDNVHLSCVTCNQFKHGNFQEYQPRLEKKIGFERVQWLHAHRHDKFEITIPELKELITVYKNKIKSINN